MQLIQAQNFHKLCILNPDILLIKVHSNGSLGAYFKSHNMYSLISNQKAKTKFTPGDIWINLDNIKNNYKLIQKRFHTDVINQRSKNTTKSFRQSCNAISQCANWLKSTYQKFFIGVLGERLALWDIPGHLEQEDFQKYLERSYFSQQYELPSERPWRSDPNTFDRFAATELTLRKREQRLFRVRATNVSRLG